jgi:hypothetical protein
MTAAAFPCALLWARRGAWLGWSGAPGKVRLVDDRIEIWWRMPSVRRASVLVSDLSCFEVRRPSSWLHFGKHEIALLDSHACVAGKYRILTEKPEPIVQALTSAGLECHESDLPKSLRSLVRRVPGLFLFAAAVVFGISLFAFSAVRA